MGKSLGNYIGVGEPAYEQFGKTMSIPDDLMREWFELLTDRPARRDRQADRPAARIRARPRKRWARTSSRFYHGAEAADKAAEEFQQPLRRRPGPDEIEERAIALSELTDGKSPSSSCWCCSASPRATTTPAA